MSCLKSPWILFGARNTSTGWWRCGNKQKISLIHLKLLFWKQLIQLNHLSNCPLLSCVTFLVAKELGKACKRCLFIISNQCVFLLLPASFLVYLIFQLKISIQKKTFWLFGCILRYTEGSNLWVCSQRCCVGSGWDGVNFSQGSIPGAGREHL